MGTRFVHIVVFVGLRFNPSLASLAQDRQACAAFYTYLGGLRRKNPNVAVWDNSFYFFLEDSNHVIMSIV
jgi:hypothetical protein